MPSVLRFAHRSRQEKWCTVPVIPLTWRASSHLSPRQGWRHTMTSDIVFGRIFSAGVFVVVALAPDFRG